MSTALWTRGDMACSIVSHNGIMLTSFCRSVVSSVLLLSTEKVKASSLILKKAVAYYAGQYTH